MNPFKLENYTDDKIVMHCPTEEQARIFLNFLHKNGRKWVSGKTYSENTRHQAYGSETCYYFNRGSYESLEYFQQEGFIILEFDDFLWEGYVNTDDITTDKSSDEKMNKFLSLFTKV